MSRNLLIADDEELERRALRRILQHEPHLAIFDACNGSEALEVVARQAIDVAILDIRMPGVGGIEVAERLRREHPDVAIVFLTAYDQFDYARSALRLQVDDFLLKPASSDEVLTVVRRVLARVDTRDGARDSSQRALQRLDEAIALVAERLRLDLAQGLPDHEQVLKYHELHGLDPRPLVVFEGRSPQPIPLQPVARLAEAFLTGADTVALAGVQGHTLRVLLMGAVGDPGEQAKRLREAVRSETGCTLWLGVALAVGQVKADTLVAVAHRAAVVAGANNPVMTVSVGGDFAAGEREAGAADDRIPPVVVRVLSLLEARLAEELALNDVAAEVGLSPSHLSRLLARSTGFGFADCLAHFRIAAAKQHLADERLAVKEVSHLVGYHDPAYFARVFRRLEGLSPADYRATLGRAP